MVCACGASLALREGAAVQGVGAAEMNNGDQPVIGVSTKYQDPGVYTVEVRVLTLCLSCPFSMSSFCFSVV